MIPIFYTGKGILTPIILVAVAVAVFFLLAPLGLDGKLFVHVTLPVSLICASAANWFIGRWFNSTPARTLVDPKTNRLVILKSTHTLLFLKMEYWSAPVALFAVISLFVK